MALKSETMTTTPRRGMRARMDRASRTLIEQSVTPRRDAILRDLEQQLEERIAVLQSIVAYSNSKA